jgi:protein TonB
VPAPTQVRLRERFAALAAVALVQIVLGAALLSGLRVDTLRSNELVSRLIEVNIPPPAVRVPVVHPREARRHEAAAPKAQPSPIGGTPGPHPAQATPAPATVIALPHAVAAVGGGSGSGPALGSGAGGGAGAEGYGGDQGGGTDLIQIAGEIRPSDYPRDLRERGIGGRVAMVFTVGTNGRVTRCSITRSSGVPELDALTCRLIEQRFRYRPSTDRYGRPIADEVEGEHDWVAH